MVDTTRTDAELGIAVTRRNRDPVPPTWTCTYSDPVDLRRGIPRTDVVLADPALAGAVGRLGREVVRSVVGRAQEAARRGEIRPDEVVAAAVRDLPRGLRPVLNATGVLMHTNLGRAPLSAAARAALDVAAGTCNVELDLTTGGRGKRGVAAVAALLEAAPAELAAPLRLGEPAVLGRVERGRCLLNLRAIAPADDAVLAAAVKALR